jgi:signal transduction histidine kinase
VQTDTARFRQVLYNLLSNAIKFTNPGGQVTITWEWVAAADLDAPVVPVEEATAFRVTVTDTGVGIAAKDQEVIFDEFRQVPRSGPSQGQGTGVGLPLTRRLVALLGGSISLSSIVDQGTTFSFVLPRWLHEERHVDQDLRLTNTP